MTYVERGADGRISGPEVAHRVNAEASFLGEISELMTEVDLLVADHGGSPQLDEDARQVVDAALAVGFDYGVEWARTHPGEAEAGSQS